MPKLTTAAKNFLLIVSIPFILAVSHDVYINYLSDSQKIQEIKRLQANPSDFMLSDLGWVWHEYSPGTMQMGRDMVDPEAWKTNVDPVLQQPTLYVAVLPLLAGVIFVTAAFILGIWPFSRLGARRKADKTGYGVYKKARGKKTTYAKK